MVLKLVNMLSWLCCGVAGGEQGPVHFGTAIDLGARLSLYNLGYLPGMYGTQAGQDAHGLRCGGRAGSGPCAAIALLLTAMPGSDVTSGACARARPHKRPSMIFDGLPAHEFMRCTYLRPMRSAGGR